MSYAPHGQGVPYGVPSSGRGGGGGGYGNQASNKGSARAARELGGALPDQTYKRQQAYRPPQSDSERRYVDRVAQELPENLRSSSERIRDQEPQYSDYSDYSDYPDYPEPPPHVFTPPPRTPPSQNSPQRANPPQPGGPYPVPTSRILRPALDQYSVAPQNTSGRDQSANPPPPRPADPAPSAWPLRLDSNNPEEGPRKGSVKAARERAQGGFDRPEQRPDILVPRLQQLSSRSGGGPAAPAPNVNYAWPTQPPLQSPPGRPVRVQTKPPQALGEPWRGEEFMSPTSPNMSRPFTDSSYTSDDSLGSIPDFPVPQTQPPSIPLPPQPSQVPGMVPRRMPLGPPPSARRGPSSYYSHMSFVSPITEEAERASYGSYASSNVIPSGVPDYYIDDTPSDDESPADREPSTSSRSADHDENSGLVRQASLGKRAKPTMVPVRENTAPSRPKRPDVSKGGIVSQAAMAAGAAGGAFAAGLGMSRDGPRETTPQPSLTSPTALADPSSSETSLSSVEGRMYNDDGSSKKTDTVHSVDVFADMKPARTHSPVQRTYQPNVSSPLSPNAPVPRAASKSPLSPRDAQMAAIMGSLEKGGTFDKDTANALKSPGAGLSQKAGLRRPPRLDMNSVREAEARGSMTSLPDLIRRATRLAANLDRGKTASKLGMDWFANEARKEGYVGDRKSGGSLSDILASFPPPGLATPTGRNSPGTRGTAWPNGSPGLDRDDLDPRFVFEKPGDRKPKRRCCGMPRWAFILLVIFIILLIVAAIVIPIGLVVIPREKSASHSGNTALSVCQKNFACENGGSSTLAPDGSCSCLCANDFTGAQCTAASDTGCTTMPVTGASKANASVGSAIPRLVDAAQSNFSIPLDTQRVFAQFSKDDASCTTQNALVTLDGAMTKRSERSVVDLYIALAADRNLFKPDTATTATATPIIPQDPVHDQAIYAVPTTSAEWDGTDADHVATSTTPALSRRATSTDSGSAQTATANGILIASGGPQSSSTSNNAATSTRNAVSATATTAAELSGTNTDSDMDFSRIAILFMLQETGSMSQASDAQGRLSDWFENSNPSAGNVQDEAKNMSLGSSGWSIDLLDLKITVQNGTVFGSGP